MKTIYRILFGIQLFVGIGALAGGYAGISNPAAPLGVPTEILKNAPFDNFLIPGIILFTVIGLGSITSALSILFKSRYRAYISNVFSWALVIWIVVQCIMLQNIHGLHVAFFLIGMLEGILSMIVLFNERLFPTNLVIDFYKKINKEM